MFSMVWRAARQASMSSEAMKMEPSSSMSILQPVSAQIFWMTLPPEPMTSRILSGLIFIWIIFGAESASSLRGSAIALSMISSRIWKRASRVMRNASLTISCLRPSFFRSIWMAVMPCFVPATLKSISPWKSSTP